MSTPMIEMHGIVKTYFEGKPNALEILHGIDLVVQPGEFVSIVGESGSGKSTLMNLIGALDRPSKGSYRLDGVDVSHASDRQLSEIRNRKNWVCISKFQFDWSLQCTEKCGITSAVCRCACKRAKPTSKRIVGTGRHGAA